MGKVKTPRKHIVQRRAHVGASIGIAGIALFAAVGTYLISSSLAAFSHNPIGYLDSCQLVSGKTVLYGWVHDPDAAAGSQPSAIITVSGVANKTVSSSIAKYRDSQINAYLTKRGIPTSSIYGWSATYTGLYKGETHTVGGTGKNVGTGANAALFVNKTTYTDGNTSKPYFAGGNIPDACMVTKPTPAPVPPTPVPAPTPAPAPTPTPITTQPKTPAKPAVSNAADASFAPGTLTAQISIPTGNATQVKIKYGTAQDDLSLSADAAINGATAAIALSQLSPSQTYYLQIVRTSGSTTTTSNVISFTTKGYSVTLVVTNGSGNLIKNTEVSIPELNVRTTSNENGVVTLSDIPPGQYTFALPANGRIISRAFSVPGDMQPQPDQNGVLGASITLDIADNISSESQPQTNSKTAPDTRSRNLIIAAGLVLPLLVGAMFFAVKYLRDRPRRLRTVKPVTHQTPAPPVAPVQPVTHHVTPPSIQTLHGPAQTPDQMNLHVGESLKDMVIKSMREEAERRRQQQK